MTRTGDDDTGDGDNNGDDDSKDDGGDDDGEDDGGDDDSKDDGGMMIAKMVAMMVTTKTKNNRVRITESKSSKTDS